MHEASPTASPRQYPMQMHGAGSHFPARRDAVCIGDTAGARVVHFRKTVGKHPVVPLHDLRRTAKIAAQGQRLKGNAADAGGACAQKHAHLRLAKPVDGLHRVPDQKERATIPRLPPRREQREQARLLQGGVLEFIDQDVTNAAVHAQCQVGRTSTLPSASRAAAAIAG